MVDKAFKLLICQGITGVSYAPVLSWCLKGLTLSLYSLGLVKNITEKLPDVLIHNYLVSLCEFHRCSPDVLSSMYSFSGDMKKVYCRFVYEGLFN